MVRLALLALALGATLLDGALAGGLNDGAEPLPRAQELEEAFQEPRNYSMHEEKENGLVHLSLGDERRHFSLNPGRYYFTSPNYPRDYPNNYHAQWTIRGSRGQSMTLWCPRFHLESAARCRYDYLSINGRKYCGNSGSLPRHSGTVMDVIFRTDRSVTRRGFYCRIDVPSPTGCCGRANRRSRIVGGVPTEVNEYPWQAALVRPGGTAVFCGGSVINNRYVLSAAHCTVRATPSSLQVLLREHRVGRPDGELRYSISRIINHPRYQSVSSGYDFTLLRLSATINFSGLGNRVAPVCMPSGGSFDNVAAIVSGWGRLSSGGSSPDVLHEVTVRTMTNSQCARSYGNSIKPTMICAGVSGGGKDSCQGDSGGPLVTDVGGRYSLIGVVSWGRGCALPNYPGVYARVTSVTSWIQQNTADASLC